MDRELSTSRRSYFATTRWTIDLAASRKSSVQSERALAELCQTYWYPLYAYTRRQNHTREESEDLVQGFFARLLEKKSLDGIDSSRGKFRSFLLASLNHFLANEWDKAKRQKRGGNIEHLSLDWQSADERYRLEPADPMSPDRIFDREWAIALLKCVITRLRDQYASANKIRLFEETRGFLMIGRASSNYSQVAARLKMDEGTVRVAVHRLRKDYRELLRNEIAQTLEDPSQTEEELRSLQAALVS